MYQSEVASEVTLLGASDRVLLGGYSQGRLPGQAAAGMSTFDFRSFHSSLASIIIIMFLETKHQKHQTE